ncbi:MAG: PRC-barrel domain-containing protein [Methanomicrobiales archaeon]|nr:PRC-barrel domain-containing protein [Methanomicrobiales archaeon]
MIETTETESTAMVERTLLAPRVLAGSRLIGSGIRNPAGEDLGTIEEIMIDVVSGRIVDAVLAYGGSILGGARYFAVPRASFIMRPGTNYGILDVPKEDLDNSPGINRAELPMTQNVTWIVEDRTRVVKPAAAPVEPLSGSDIIGLRRGGGPRDETPAKVGVGVTEPVRAVAPGIPEEGRRNE